MVNYPLVFNKTNHHYYLTVSLYSAGLYMYSTRAKNLELLLLFDVFDGCSGALTLILYFVNLRY